jgi:hypothetical protein
MQGATMAIRDSIAGATHSFEFDEADMALDGFKRLNETHHPQPLPKEVLVELDRILAAAEREARQID